MYVCRSWQYRLICSTECSMVVASDHYFLILCCHHRYKQCSCLTGVITIRVVAAIKPLPLDPWLEAPKGGMKEGKIKHPSWEDSDLGTTPKP